VIRILFGIIASLGILMALGTVLARNLIHAALFLVAFFFLIACQFVLLEAEFMAAMQVLVYIGAIAILLLFGIMLTRNIQGDETTASHWIRKIPAAVAAIGVLAILAVGIVDDRGTVRRPAWETLSSRPELVTSTPGEDPSTRTPSAAVVNNMSRAVGIELMTRFAIPFEVAGLLLTAAIVGAIALAQNDGGDEGSGPRRGAALTVRPTTSEGPGNGSAAPEHRTSEALSTPAGTA
jgi:NADH-quinone oxidoreductase subunit J